MCFAIIEVKYRAASLPDETIKLTDEAALEARLESLKKNEQIERIRIFTPTKTLSRHTMWLEE